MRLWVGSIEEAIDKKLIKWKKAHTIENGEAVQLKWEFLQTQIVLYVFWENNKEAVHFQYLSPRASFRFEWPGLTGNTFTRVMDRVGNLAQITMWPPTDPSLVRE